MGYQFAHLELYSRKGKAGRSTAFVLAEARRDLEASHHVENPRPPDLLYGCDLDELERQHDDRAVAAKAIRKGPKGESLRAIRKDQNTLAAVVVSHPYTVEEVEADPVKRAEIECWEKANIDWLKTQFGDDLASVVRHTDEKQWHLHAYALPSNPEMKAALMHPGQLAKAAVMEGAEKGDKERNRAGDRAYREAMRQWQETYFQAVSLDAGLTRLGPGRRRLSRDAWKAEQVQARAVKIAEQKAAKYVRYTKDKGAAYVDRVKREAVEIRRTAEAQAKVAKAAHDRAIRIERRAMAILERARLEATRILDQVAPFRKLGSRLRSMVDGLRVSTIEQRVRSNFAEEVSALSGRLDEERRARRQAERGAVKATEQRAEIALEHEMTTRELTRAKALIPAKNDESSQSGRELTDVEWYRGGRHGV